MSTNNPEFDRRMMSRAITLARRGEGRVEPNPMVGCVIVRRGRVIGEGYHRRFGGPHAEIEALRSCASSPRGATVYVSLEPCCRQGKTPPCTEALIAAKVARVVVAVHDAHPSVGGRGLRALRRAGLRVHTGVLRKEASEVLAPFTTRVRLGRPYVIAKWAQSLDGKLATHRGDSRWISGEVSRRHVHRLRARMDAILVGSGTVLVDDPRLTARGVVIRRTALRVALDTRLRIPTTCQLVDTARQAPTLVMTTASRARSPKARQLMRKGVEVIACPVRGRRLSLDGCLSELGRRDLTNLLVEGGPTMLTSFLQANVVDEAYVFIAPKLIGHPRAPSLLAGDGARRIEDAISPRQSRMKRSGDDILCHMRLT